MRDLPTGTVTFLFTDIEGSTRLLEELGAGYVDALAEHRRAIREACARNGGVEVDTQGDAFFLAFAEAAAAARAAAAAQADLARGPIRVRMGLHTGEPLVWAEGYAGVDVHRGARICGAAHGGQVVLSERTAALVTPEGVRSLGQHRLKDLSQPAPLFQLGDGDFPPLRTLHATNLPAQPGQLIGRERELAETTGLLDGQTRLLTLIGPGGSGKTRLALQVAAERAEDYPDGVFWVPLAGVDDPALVLPTAAGTIGAKDELAEHLGDKRMLLLLDNFEQVLKAGTGLSEVLQHCPNVKLLVTSRAALRLAGEWEYEVEPLPETDAVRLFTERARAIVSGFEPDDSVAEICGRLDRLPLAIELAAARTRVLSPPELLARLEQRLPLLTGGPRDAPDRQRTLRATIEWSHDLLDATEQDLFARLAVFAGSFDLAAAEAVCGAPLDGIESLVEQSLLRRWGSGRLGMLETIREFALERLEGSGERDAVARAHLEYFLALAERAEFSGEGYGPGWLDRLSAERDNVRVAMRWALDAGEPVLALRLASALGRLWVIRDHKEGYGWLAEALADAGDAAPPDVRAAGLMWAGSSVFFTGDFQRAAALFEEALDLFRRLEDTLHVARVLDRLSAPVGILGDPERARALAEESLALFRELDDRPGSVYPLSKVALDEWQRGSKERGAELMEEALALSRESGDSWWTAGLLQTVAEFAWKQGDSERATELAREGLSLAFELGNAPHLVYGLGLLAVFAAACGDRRRAGRLWGAVEALEERGEATLEDEARTLYAEALLAQSDAEFESGRAAGRSLPLDEAVAEALAAD